MKKHLLFMVLAIPAFFSMMAQGVAVNDDGAAADNSAILDISSTLQGILIPRMTTTQRDAIANPAPGLIIFNIDINGLQWACTDSNWFDIRSGKYFSYPIGKCFGGSVSEIGYDLWRTNDNNSVFIGNAASNDGDVSGNHGNTDFWVVKLDSSDNISWQKCLGGTSMDDGRSIVETTDGGYIAVGNAQSNNGNVSGNHGSQDCWVVRLDSTGSILWQKCLGGSGYEIGNSIRQTPDSNYIIAGGTSSNNGDVTGNHGSYDFWIVKLSPSGNIIWQKCYGGTNVEIAIWLDITPDSNYIVCGYTNSTNGDVSGNHGGEDYWILKLDTAGNILMNKCYGGSSYDYANKILCTPESGFIVTGYSNSNNGDVSGNHGDSDNWVILLDSAGTIEWQKSLGGPGVDQGYSVAITSDSSYIVVGNSSNIGGNVTVNHGNQDYWIIKLDSGGSLLWQKSIGGSHYESAFDIEIEDENTFIVVGYTGSTDYHIRNNHSVSNYYDVWFMRLSQATGEP